MTHGIRRRFLRLAFVLALLPLAGCGAFRGFEKTTSKFFFPASTEKALGDQYAGEIQSEFEIVQDPVVQPWLDRVGAALVANSPETPHEFNFYLTSAPEVNAFAIPGGHCYVNAGLILYADNEAQVVAVVGHEINHVTQRHGMLHMQRAMGLSLVAVGIGVFVDSAAARAASIAATSAGGYVAIQSFGRDDERESDKLGVEAMYHAGWDPREAARFFEKLHALGGGNTPGFLDTMLSTHPATLERVENIEKQVADYDLVSVPLVVDTPEFQAVQARLEAIYGAFDAGDDGGDGGQ